MAGVFGVLVLFGIIPPAMSWAERYTPGTVINQLTPPMVPGGRATLLAIGGTASAIVLADVIVRLSHALAGSAP